MRCEYCEKEKALESMYSRRMCHKCRKARKLATWTENKEAHLARKRQRWQERNEVDHTLNTSLQFLTRRLV